MSWVDLIAALFVVPPIYTVTIGRWRSTHREL